MNRLITTLNIGGDYLGQDSRRSFCAAAKRWGADYLEIISDVQPDSHPWHQKLMVHQRIPDDTRVVYFDGDCVVRSDCPNIFEVVPDDQFGITRHNFPGHEYFDEARRAAHWIKRTTGYDFDPENFSHAGVFCYNTSHHRQVFQEALALIDQSGWDPSWWISDQAPLSYTVEQFGNRFWLPQIFGRCGLWWDWSPEMHDPVWHFASFGKDKASHFIKHTMWDNLTTKREHKGIVRWEYSRPSPMVNGYETEFLIREWAKVYKGVVVELGVWLGGSTYWGGKTAKNHYSKYFAIDAWDQHHSPEMWPEVNREHLYEAFLLNLHDMRLAHDVTVIKSDTADASARFEDGSVDLVFVDADHSFEGVVRDVTAWWPKLKVGGVILGHDYTPQRQGVIDAVEHVFGGPDEISRGDWPVWKVVKHKGCGKLRAGSGTEA